jgi:hypothetical protein
VACGSASAHLARQANGKTPTHGKLYSLADIGRIMADICKKRKELPQIPGLEDSHPF